MMTRVLFSLCCVAFFLGSAAHTAPVSLTVVGETHEGDAKSDRRRAELIRRYAKGKGDILLAMENAYTPGEKRVWIEKVWGTLPEPESIGVDGNLPHATAVYSIFRYWHNRRFLMLVVRDAPAEAKLKAGIDQFYAALDMLGEEPLLALLHEAKEKPQLLKIPAMFKDAGMTQKELEGAYLSLLASMESKELLQKTEKARTDQEKLDALTDEQIQLWFSNKGLILSAALTNFLDTRIVEELEKSQSNANLQTPKAIIEHFKNFPELTRTRDPRALLKAPYNSPLNDTVLVTWRNDVMVRNLAPVVASAQKSGKPVYLIVGKKHVDHMVEALKKAYPEAKIAQE